MKDVIQEMLLESAETIKKSVQLSNKIEEAIIVICDCIFKVEDDFRFSECKNQAKCSVPN